jgi:predicted secreted acid phosphatase
VGSHTLISEVFDAESAHEAVRLRHFRPIAGNVRSYLAKRDKQYDFTGDPALIFDIDDTTLTTYDYEICSSFVYNPTTNAVFVDNAVFPAAPGIVDLVTWARDHGYTVFFLTGRPETQRTAR